MPSSVSASATYTDGQAGEGALWRRLTSGVGKQAASQTRVWRAGCPLESSLPPRVGAADGGLVGAAGALGAAPTYYMHTDMSRHPACTPRLYARTSTKPPASRVPPLRLRGGARPRT